MQRAAVFASDTGDWQSTVCEIEAPLQSWFKASGYRAAIWTDLPGNFQTETGGAFSLAAADTYLQSLSGEPLLEAKRYIELAPEETVTALRKHLHQQDWWRAVPLVKPELQDA